MVRDPLLTNIYLALVNDNDVRAAVECYQENHRAFREMQAIKSGDRAFLAATRSPLDLTAPQSAIEDRLHTISLILSDSYNRLCQRNQAILNRYFPSPPSQ